MLLVREVNPGRFYQADIVDPTVLEKAAIFDRNDRID